jgi:hypothetical protein
MLAHTARLFVVFMGVSAALACKSDPAADGGASGSSGGGQQALAGEAVASGGRGGNESSAGRAGALASAGAAAAGGGAGARAGAGGMAGATPAGRSGGNGGAGAGGARGGAGGSSAAGSGGASGSGTQAFFGASRCTSSFLLCDGFENAALDKSVWQTKFGAPAVDSTRAARGSHSLHLSTTATGSSGIEVTKIFPTANNDYYGRLFVYFDALPSRPQWAPWTIVGATGSAVAGEIRVGGQFDGKINRFGVGTDRGPTGDWTNLDADAQAGSTQIREDQWLCVEWQHDGATDQSRFYLDGVEHPSLGTTRDVKHDGNSSVKYDLPDMSAVWVGFWNYDQGKTVTPNHFDVWIDEVALDDERIGCSL